MIDYFVPSLNLRPRWNLGGDTPRPSGAKGPKAIEYLKCL